jgi:ubiquinone/menaquinone biosynthesis C-methylase UbiE
VQVGCCDVEFTMVLTGLFDHVLAVDTSESVLEAAREAAAREGVTNVDFQLVSQDRLDGVADEIADAVVECGFLEQLHRKAQLFGQLTEFARVLRRPGRAYVTVPLALRGPKSLLRPPGTIAISERQLAQALTRAGFTVHASDEAARGRFTRDLLLHLERE